MLNCSLIFGPLNFSEICYSFSFHVLFVETLSVKSFHCYFDFPYDGSVLGVLMQAQDFRQHGTKMRRKMWLQNMKIKLIVLAIIIALILIIVLSICGGFKCKWDPHAPSWTSQGLAYHSTVSRSSHTYINYFLLMDSSLWCSIYLWDGACLACINVWNVWFLYLQ